MRGVPFVGVANTEEWKSASELEGDDDAEFADATLQESSLPRALQHP